VLLLAKLLFNFQGTETETDVMREGYRMAGASGGVGESEREVECKRAVRNLCYL